MDAMFWMQLIVVVIAIGIGAKWGGLGLGAAGGLGLFVLVFFFGLKPGNPPVSVLLIMVAVVSCASILQGSGGLDYLVGIAERILRRNPQHITFMGPLVCFFFTLLCGTGYVAFAVYPVIAEVAAAARVRPERPLSMSVIGAQAAITGSPMSAATAAMIGLFAAQGVLPFHIFAVCIPATFLGVLVGCAFVYKRGAELEKDPEFLRKVKSGEFVDTAVAQGKEVTYSPAAKRGVVIFLFGILLVVLLGSFPGLLPKFTDGVGKVTRLGIPHMVQMVMLAVGCLIMVISKVPAKKLADGSVFRAGLIGMAAVFGISWLTGTFFNTYKPVFVAEFGTLIQELPILFALAMFFLSSVLFSQGATTTALMPLAIGLGLLPADCVWMFLACNGYFLIPAGGAVIACIAFDRTGTMKIGKYVLNHSYQLPGLVTTGSTLLFGWLLSKVVF